jgi:hypothetical protein
MFYNRGIPDIVAIRLMLARDPLRLAAARLAAEYVSRAASWAGDVDEGLVIDLERVHRRIVDDIDEMLAAEEEPPKAPGAAGGGDVAERQYRPPWSGMRYEGDGRATTA